MKISEWLREHCDSHAIFNNPALTKSFEEKTGEKPCWPRHTVAVSKAAVIARGVGGYVNGKDEEIVAWGYEIASSLAREHVPEYQCTKMGRGFIFTEALQALEAAGK